LALHTGPTQRGAQYHYNRYRHQLRVDTAGRLSSGAAAAEGLARSVFELLEVALPVPSYSTLSRRAAALSVVLGVLRVLPPAPGDRF